MVTIRQETPEDETTIHQINREAFGQPDEADIISRLRHRGALTISLVAVLDGEPVAWPIPLSYMIGRPRKEPVLYLETIQQRGSRGLLILLLIRMLIAHPGNSSCKMPCVRIFHGKNR